MKHKHLKKRLKYFKVITKLGKKDVKQYIKTCPATLIHVICEACFNLCNHDELNSDKTLCKKIEPLKISIKKLANEKIHVQHKRDILQKVGAELISLINYSILPLLKNML